MLGQEFHCKMDSPQVPAGYVQVPGLGGTSGQAHGVELLQLRRRDVDAHVGFSAEDYALLFHEPYSAAHHLFVQLEVRYAKGEQAAGILVPLEDGDVMSGPVQLLGCGESCRT